MGNWEWGLLRSRMASDTRVKALSPPWWLTFPPFAIYCAANVLFWIVPPLLAFAAMDSAPHHPAIPDFSEYAFTCIPAFCAMKVIETFLGVCWLSIAPLYSSVLMAGDGPNVLRELFWRYSLCGVWLLAASLISAMVAACRFHYSAMDEYIAWFMYFVVLLTWIGHSLFISMLSFSAIVTRSFGVRSFTICAFVSLLSSGMIGYSDAIAVPKIWMQLAIFAGSSVFISRTLYLIKPWRMSGRRAGLQNGILRAVLASRADD
ncbi:hypothetical protein BH09SUM1_BH09SUM1_29490 [soil metagenome]